MIMPKSLTTEDFITRSITIHKDKYNYKNTCYLNSHSKLLITCPIHGDFYQLPLNHLKGKGCKQCRNQGLKLEDRIKQFKIIHKNKYDYGKVNYKGNKTPIKIICPEHGEFEQLPSVHLLGCGCQKCAKDKTNNYHRNKPTGWGSKNWFKLAKTSKNFDSFKVYIIKCWNENEEFYKIGRTYNSLSRRFMGVKNMPYKYEIVKIFEGEAKEMFDLENKLKKENKEFKYKPILYLRGNTECFNNIKN